MADLKIPTKIMSDKFNLQDYKDDFNALNSELISMAINIKTLGAVGDGVTDDTPIFISAMNIKNLLIPEGIYKITSNVVLNGCVTMNNGAILNVATGVTVTFNKSIVAQRHKIFNLQGISSIVIGISINKVFPEWWGAVSDGITDCTAPIQSALDSLTRGYVSLCAGSFGLTNPSFSLGDGAYKISSSLYVRKSCTGIRGNKGQAVIGTVGTGACIIVAPVSFSEFCFIEDLILVKVGTVTFGNDPSLESMLLIYDTLRVDVKRVRILGSSHGFYFANTINCHVSDCIHEAVFGGADGYARSFNFDGNAHNSANISSNASIRIENCISAITDDFLGESVGFYIYGCDIRDIFIQNCETSSTTYGVLIDQFSGAIVNGIPYNITDFGVDLQINNFISDGFKKSGIKIKGMGKRGSVSINGGWFAPKSGSINPISIYGDSIWNCCITGAIQFYGSLSSTATGVQFDSCQNCVISSNIFKNLKNPVYLNGCNNMIVQSNTISLCDDYFQGIYGSCVGDVAIKLVGTGVSSIVSNNINSSNSNKFVYGISLDASCGFNNVAYNSISGSSVITSATHNLGANNIIVGAFI